MKASRLTVLGCSLVVLLAGCGEKTTEGGSAAVAAKLVPVPHVAWLSRHLPAETIAYLRIPTLWDALARPKEDALHPVQTSESHRDQIAAIRKALAENILSDLPPDTRVPAQLLLSQLDSPLELAALKAEGGSLAPNALIAAKLSVADQAGFASWLAELSDSSPLLRVLTPPDDEGYTTLTAGPLQVFGHFNADEGRLLLLTGAAPSRSDLAGYVDAAAADSPLSAFEAGIDATGRGLALWLDVDRLYPMYRPMMPPAEAAQMVAAGLDQVDFLWLGSASKAGKSSFKVHLQMPEVGFRTLFARPATVPTLQTAGEAELALRLALPSVSEVGEALEYLYSLSADGGAMRRQLSAGKEKLDQQLGFDSSLILEALGPEIIAVSDQAGFWGGYQIRDQRALEDLLAAIQKLTETQITSHRAGSAEVSYLALPTLFSRPEFSEMDDAIPEPWRSVIKRVKTRLYWVQEDDYLVMASVPQVLAARAQIDPHRPIGDWLTGQMQLNWEHSILALASRVRHSPRDVYHAYLGALNLVADLTGAEIDPFAMPTWIDAGLPENGRLGVRVDSGPESFSLSLDYEYSPMEVFLGGNSMAGIAALGVAAAIAIPAYQEYIVRSQVIEGLSRSAAYKVGVAETFYSLDRFPNQAEALEIMGSYAGDGRSSMEIQPDTGVIAIYFGDQSQAQLTGKSMYLEPVADAGGGLTWACYSEDIPTKHLPASCRD